MLFEELCDLTLVHSAHRGGGDGDGVPVLVAAGGGEGVYGCESGVVRSVNAEGWEERGWGERRGRGGGGGEARVGGEVVVVVDLHFCCFLLVEERKEGERNMEIGCV